MSTVTRRRSPFPSGTRTFCKPSCPTSMPGFKTSMIGLRKNIPIRRGVQKAILSVFSRREKPKSILNIKQNYLTCSFRSPMETYKFFQRIAYVVAFGGLIASPVLAQSTIQPFGNGAIVNTPGQPPTTVQPFGNGAIINTPGQTPSTVQPFGTGAIVNTPGQPATTVQPFGNGAIVNTPGQAPSTIQPFGNGGIINTPGQPPTIVQPFGNGTLVHQ